MSLDKLTGTYNTKAPVQLVDAMTAISVVIASINMNERTLKKRGIVNER